LFTLSHWCDVALRFHRLLPNLCLSSFGWQDSDAFDWQKFPNHPLSVTPTPNHFDSAPDPRVEELLKRLSDAEDWDSFMETNGTQAFIAIQDGTILYENYFNDIQRDSKVTRDNSFTCPLRKTWSLFAMVSSTVFLRKNGSNYFTSLPANTEKI